jgi:hypothetical protein
MEAPGVKRKLQNLAKRTPEKRERTTEISPRRWSGSHPNRNLLTRNGARCIVNKVRRLAPTGHGNNLADGCGRQRRVDQLQRRLAVHEHAQMPRRCPTSAAGHLRCTRAPSCVPPTRATPGCGWTRLADGRMETTQLLPLDKGDRDRSPFDRASCSAPSVPSPREPRSQSRHGHDCRSADLSSRKGLLHHTLRP